MTAERSTETMITVTALRQICGAKAGEIEALARARLISVRAGRVGLVAGVRAYLDAIRSATKSASLAAAQDASRSARADAAELSLAVDDRRLVSQAEADHALATVCGAVMSRTFAIAARATRDVRERRQIEAGTTEMQMRIAAAVGGAEFTSDLGPQAAKRRGKK